jgi:hypothetical protein
MERILTLSKEEQKRLVVLNEVEKGKMRMGQAAGYRLIREEPHHSFSHDLIGETWELKL